jgi:hypothetical protein
MKWAVILPVFPGFAGISQAVEIHPVSADGDCPTAPSDKHVLCLVKSENNPEAPYSVIKAKY